MIGAGQAAKVFFSFWVVFLPAIQMPISSPQHTAPTHPLLPPPVTTQSPPSPPPPLLRCYQNVHSSLLDFFALSDCFPSSRFATIPGSNSAFADPPPYLGCALPVQCLALSCPCLLCCDIIASIKLYRRTSRHRSSGYYFHCRCPTVDRLVAWLPRSHPLSSAKP